MFFAAAFVFLAAAYSAYKRHANDKDVNAVLSAYPTPKGTRDFEWEKVRDQFVAEEKLAIFGALKSQEGK